MDNSFPNRLETLLSTLGVEKQVFAQEGEISKQTFSGILTGRSEPNRLVLTRWLKKYNINANWLLLGEGEMFRGEEQATAQAAEAPPQAIVDPIAQRVDSVERALRRSGASDEAIQRAIFTIIDSLQAAAQGGTKRESGAA